MGCFFVRFDEEPLVQLGDLVLVVLDFFVELSEPSSHLVVTQPLLDQCVELALEAGEAGLRACCFVDLVLQALDGLVELVDHFLLGAQRVLV